MVAYPPQLTRNLIEYFEKLVGPGNSVLVECYKAKILYGCEYPPSVETQLNTLHEKCWKEVGPPWWADMLS